jgi:hypothetical protein
MFKVQYVFKLQLILSFQMGISVYMFRMTNFLPNIEKDKN